MDLNKVKEYLANVKNSINELSVYDLDVYTAIELYYRISSKMNEVIKEVNIHTDCFDYLLNDGLVEEVIKKIDSLVADGTMDRIINQEVFGEINNLLNELSTRLDQTILNIDNELKNQWKAVKMGDVDTEPDYIYPWDKMSLSGTQTWAYYDSNNFPEHYPQAMIDKDGTLKLKGICKIDTNQSLAIDPDGSSMILLCKLFHFSIEAFEGVPLWGNLIGINDNDFNDSILIPFIIKPNGNLLIKNLGSENYKYYTRIVLDGININLHWRGQEIIDKNINEAIQESLSHGINLPRIIYFTDLHNDINRSDNYRRKETLKALQKLEARLDPVTIISGGDNIDDQLSRSEAIICHKEVCNTFRNDKFIFSNGNHDINILKNSSEYVLPVHLKPMINNSKTVYGGTNKYYSYTDYDDYKIRVISFDTYESDFDNNVIQAGANVSTTQLDWIKNAAMDMTGKKDYSVICVGHSAPVPLTMEDYQTELTNHAEIRNLLENFKNGTGDFQEQGAIKLVGFLAGHEHYDRIQNFNGITYFNSLLSWPTPVGYQLPNENYITVKRDFGTEYELCINIITIDDINRKVYIDRVGRKTNKVNTVFNF